MAKNNTFQPVTLKPLTGILDVRSNIDETPPGAFRYKLNFAINPDGKLSRALGWTRPFTSICAYKNWDFFNQGDGFTGDDREPITLMFQSVKNDGTRRLFIGTKTRLGVLSESAGNYTIIGSGFGADGDYSKTQLRFHAAELQNKVFFTNDHDLVQYHDVGSGTVQPIDDLTTAGEDGGAVTKARVVIEFNGVIMLMNLEEDGERRSYRIRWSDLNDGTAFDESDPESITDYQDLDYGEVILNAVKLAGYVFVFTNISIWRCTLTIDNSGAEPDATMNCVKIYTEPRNRAKCLAYPNAIISTGFEIFYMGSDGIYRFDPLLPQPERVEWIHRSTGIIYKESATRIDKNACQSPIMEYVPGPNDDETAGSGELHVSWPVYDPIAVAVGGEPGAIDCDEYVPAPPVVGSGINLHTLVLNLKYSTCDYRDYGSTAMVNFTSELLSGACAQQAMFLAASGADFAIKLMNYGYSRGYYDLETGEFNVSGYFSKLRGVYPFEKFEAEKCIDRFLLGILSADQNETVVARLRIGTSFEALDPNPLTGRCRVIWHQLSNKAINCRNTKTPENYLAANERPDNPVEWRFFYKGKFLYYEITLANPDGTAPTSGGCELSRFECRVKLV